MPSRNSSDDVINSFISAGVRSLRSIVSEMPCVLANLNELDRGLHWQQAILAGFPIPAPSRATSFPLARRSGG